MAAIDDPEIAVEARYDGATEVRRLVVIRTHHGTPHVTAIDNDFLATGDAAQIRTALRADARLHSDDRRLRALYEGMRDSLKLPAFRVRYAVADTGRMVSSASTFC